MMKAVRSLQFRLRRGIWYELRLYLKLIGIAIRSRMQYRSDFLFGVIGVLVLNLVNLSLIYIMVARFQALAGWRFWEIVMLYGTFLLSHSVYAVFFWHLSRLEEDILHGRLDLTNTKKEIVDLKARQKKMPTTHYESSLQFTMYHMLYRLVHGEDPAGVVIEELINKKTPERVQVKTTRSRADYSALLNTTEVVLRAIRAGIFPGAYGQMGAWWCSKESCGYWGTCPFVPESKR